MTSNKHKNRFILGTTLVEIIIYTGILAIILLLIYNLFTQTSALRVEALNNNALYVNSNRAFQDLSRTIKQANAINAPAFHSSGPTLSLNSGTIIYSVDSNGRLQKNENGEINIVTDKDILVSNLRFEVEGPSILEPTVKISFTLSSKSLYGQRTENFQTAVSLR